MTLEHIAKAWRERFGDALPAGFLCRNSALQDRWLRIHSLPGSQRYPADDADLAEVLRRQNTVAEELLGEGQDCLLFFLHWGDGTAGMAVDPEASWHPELLGREPELAMTAEVDDEPLAFFAVPVTWRRGAFDRLIEGCANDQTGHVLLANLSRGSIYAPYDGGADLFYPSRKDVGPARARHRAWLSTHPGGL